jgi:hypothetical protein
VEDHGALYERARDRLVRQISLVQFEVAELRKALVPVKDAKAVPPAEELEAIASSIESLTTLAAALQAPLDESPRLAALAAAAVEALDRNIAAAARDAAALDPANAPADAAAARAAAVSLAERIAAVDDACLVLVVPYRVRMMLRSRRVGRALPFLEVFDGEPPPAERRATMLKQLEAMGSYLAEGVVDVNRELIWRKSGSAATRALSALSPVLFAALGALVLIAISSLPSLDDSPLGNGAEVLEAYVVVTMGVAVHLLVENVKLSQEQNAPILAIGEFVDWLHLRWAGIGSTFFAILVTVIGLRLTFDAEALNKGWETTLLYFFAGYSVDSVAGIFLQRFGTSAKAGVSGLLSRVRAPGEGA